ncbi:MAG TPA: hypothetical protein VF286_00975 [Acidiphilium sp.]
MRIWQDYAFEAEGTVAIAATETSASLLLPLVCDAVLITNPTSSLAFVRRSHDPEPATEVDLPVLPNSQILMGTGLGIRTINVVLASGSGTIYATAGHGTQY